MNPIQKLMLEGIPTRPTPVDPGRMKDGPTGQWIAREKWLLLSEIAADELDEDAV
jgi:hypothetical protein